MPSEAGQNTLDLALKRNRYIPLTIEQARGLSSLGVLKFYAFHEFMRVNLLISNEKVSGTAFSAIFALSKILTLAKLALAAGDFALARKQIAISRSKND